jgi:hypothetical protein
MLHSNIGLPVFFFRFPDVFPLDVFSGSITLYVQRAEACCETLEELLYMDEEKLASLMLSPPGAQREDVRLKGLLDSMPGILRELSRPHVTRMVVWE